MNFKHRMSAVILISSVTVGLSCHSAPAPIRAVAGCYAVTVGPWLSNPHSSHPYAPPDTIRLTTARIADSSAERYQVQPDAFATGSHGATSFWARTGDSIIIVWSVAFAGVAIRVTPTASGLAGRVQSWTDVVVTDEKGQVPWPSAPVRLVPSRCFTLDAA